MLFFFSLIHSLPIRIKFRHTQRYLRGSDGRTNVAHLADFDHADKFNFLWDENETKHKYLRISRQLQFSLAFDYLKGHLILTHSDTSPGQCFEFIPINIHEGEYWIVNQGQCLTWVENSKQFVLEKCGVKNNNQIFQPQLDDFENARLTELRDYVGEEMHLSPNSKELKLTHNLKKETYEEAATHLEGDGRDAIHNVYKYLYDMNLCFLENGMCQKDAWFEKALIHRYKSLSKGKPKKKSKNNKQASGNSPQ